MSSTLRDRVNDGAYRNLIVGIGDHKADKSMHTSVAGAAVLSYEELAKIFFADGIGAKIVTCVAGDATAKGWDLSDDKDGLFYAALADLGVPRLIRQAAVNARLMGGSIVLMQINDGRQLDQPAGDGPIVGFKQWSAGRLNFQWEDISIDSRSKYFDRAEFYKIKRRDGTYFTVHSSRCIVFPGIPVPDVSGTMAFPATLAHFGMSALQRVYDRLKGYGAAMQGVDNMLLEADVGVYSLTGLYEQMAASDGGVRGVEERLQVMHLAKSMLRGLIIDKDDTYSNMSHNFTGLADLIGKSELALCAAADIPYVRLFGNSASGLNATGEGDSRNYYDSVESFRVDSLEDGLRGIVQEVRRRNGINVGDSVAPIWAPVWAPTQVQLVDMRLKVAQTDDLNIRNQVYGPHTARSRYEGGFGLEVNLVD